MAKPQRSKIAAAVFFPTVRFQSDGSELKAGSGGVTARLKRIKNGINGYGDGGQHVAPSEPPDPYQTATTTATVGELHPFQGTRGASTFVKFASDGREAKRRPLTERRPFRYNGGRSDETTADLSHQIGLTADSMAQIKAAYLFSLPAREMPTRGGLWLAGRVKSA